MRAPARGADNLISASVQSLVERVTITVASYRCKLITNSSAMWGHKQWAENGGLWRYACC